MNVYFANRDGKVLYSTSSGLPGNSNILSDSIEASIESGVKTLTLTLHSDEEARKNVVVGNLVMLGGKLDYSLFTIMEVEHNAADNILSIYGEDAGIDLINKLVNAWNPTAEQTIVSAMKSVLSYSESTGLYDGWNVNYGISTTKTIGASSFEFSNEDTALARMLSIVDIFDAEAFFSYEIDGLHLIRRNINIVKKIGEKPDFKVFRLGEDISNIVERISINDVATAFSLYGKDSNGSKKKLSSLTGYSAYENMVIEPDDKSIFTGDRKHRYKVVGNEVRCIDGMDRWKSTLDSDGKIVRVKETEYKTAKLCISYAMKELEKVVDEDAEYTVEFSNAPDVGVGEYIKIVDANDRLYLQARVLEWKRSIIDNTFDCTIGDFKRLYSSKAELITNIEAVFQAISEIETVAQEAKTTAEGAYDYADGIGTDAVNTAKGYTDGEVSDLKDYVDSADSTLTQYMDGIKEDLQNQIDGNITTWFYAYVPTSSNAPANGWTTTALKNEHLGDLFYNTSNGYCYRWMLDGSTYKWQMIQDTDITEALAKAQHAQDTADGKRRIFYAQPTPPYDKGDLWTQGSTGDILRCNTARASGSYVAGDWVLASKYTDDTLAEEAKTTAEGAQELAEEAESNAQSALTAAQTAQTAANNAVSSASQAATAAQNALTSASEAASLASAANTAANNAGAAAALAQTAADAALEASYKKYGELTLTDTQINTRCALGHEETWARQTGYFQGAVNKGDILVIYVKRSSKENSVAELLVRAENDTAQGVGVYGTVIRYEDVNAYFWHDNDGAHILSSNNGYRNDLDGDGMSIVANGGTKVASFGIDGAYIGTRYGTVNFVDKTQIVAEDNGISIKPINTPDGTFFPRLEMYHDVNDSYRYDRSYVQLGVSEANEPGVTSNNEFFRASITTDKETGATEREVEIVASDVIRFNTQQVRSSAILVKTDGFGYFKSALGNDILTRGNVYVESDAALSSGKKVITEEAVETLLANKSSIGHTHNASDIDDLSTGDGYIQIGGITIAWGSVNVSIDGTAEKYATVNFPVEFKTVPKMVTNYNGSATFKDVHTGSITTTSARVYCSGSSSSSSGTRAIHWIAIG